jgi:aspartyl-tRNA synthetase
MSFVTMEDVMEVVETILERIWKNALNIDIPRPIPRMPYQVAISRYGIDKPDTRYGFEIQDVTQIFHLTKLQRLKEGLINATGKIQENEKGCVKALVIKRLAKHVTSAMLQEFQTQAKHGGGEVWKFNFFFRLSFHLIICFNSKFFFSFFF